MTLASTYDRNFYEGQKAGSFRSAELVIEQVLPIIGDIGSVVDIGCGAGGWLRAFKERLPELEILGLDGGGVPEETLFIDPAHYRAADLTKPQDLGRKFDLAVTLEVIEHIPSDHTDAFVQTLSRSSDVVLFSAAVPRQGGTGHVNEQWPDYWISQMQAAGFVLHDVVRPLIWTLEDVRPWYKQNCFLFAKPERKLHLEGLEDWSGRAMVHPQLFAMKTETFAEKVRRVLAGRKP